MLDYIKKAVENQRVTIFSRPVKTDLPSGVVWETRAAGLAQTGRAAMNTRSHHATLKYVAHNVTTVVPTLLQELPQWIGWSAGPMQPDGKFDKYPKGRDGTGDRWQTPAQWMTFEDALVFAKQRGLSGVGLVLPAKTPNGLQLVALDYDGVDLTGSESARVQEIMRHHENLGSPYVEVSPSGKGIRMFVLSAQPLPQISASNPLGGKDELFCASGKWVTITGDTLGGTDVLEATEAISAIAEQWEARSPAKPSRRTSDHSGSGSGRMLGHLTGGWQGWPMQKLRDGDGREEMMLAYAGHLRAKGLDQATIERMCLEANKERYEDQLEEDVVLDRAQRYEAHSSGEAVQASDAVLEQVDQTDAGNVARLWELTLGDARYVHEMGVWILWNQNRWEFDRSLSGLHRLTLGVAATYARKLKRLQTELDDPSANAEQRKALRDAVKSLEKWVAQCRNRSRIEAMIALAQKDPRFVISAGDLDRDPHLIGVANGVVCLRTGTVRPDGKNDLILRRSPVAFNPNSSTAAIRKFVAEVTSWPDGLEDGKVKPSPRPILARYLQKLGGYCLTGLTKEQVMFMLSGKGANGKSVLVDVLKQVLGDYCEVVQPEILLSTKGASSAEQASPSTRKLAGARCVITSESKEGAQLDVAVIKRHTGDRQMTARGLFERPITFDVTHKLLLLTNHPPRADHMDDAIKGRLHVIPFDLCWNRPGTTEYDPTLPDADKDLPAKLKAEAEGVLLYFIEGAVMYFQDGLAPPPEVTRFTQGYITSQDTVRKWLNEECVPCPLEEGATASQLHASYRKFCAGEGEREQADSAAALGRRLKQMGYQSQRTRDGTRYALKSKELPPHGGVSSTVLPPLGLQ